MDFFFIFITELIEGFKIVFAIKGLVYAIPKLNEQPITSEVIWFTVEGSLVILSTLLSIILVFLYFYKTKTTLLKLFLFFINLCNLAWLIYGITLEQNELMDFMIKSFIGSYCFYVILTIGFVIIKKMK